MTTELKKISELSVTRQFDGTESVPLLKKGSNPRATLGDLKEYFRDSTLAIFSEIDESNPEVSNKPVSDYYQRDIVYLLSKNAFVERVEYHSSQRIYTTSFDRREDYMDGDNVRRDKVFFNLTDKELYVFDGDLRNIFDTVRINAMTEEEFSKLENPIEGAFYATYEE